MGEIIAIHSFRGGTGKSNITANLAYLIARQGHRVGVVDTDVQSPGIHTLFGLSKDQFHYTLNDYLLARQPIEAVAYDLSDQLRLAGGHLFLVPASMDLGEISHILKEGYNVALLNAGLREIVKQLALDYLLVDTHPGINEETLLSISLANHTLVVMRADQQDYQGTSLTVAVARKLGARPALIINMLPEIFDQAEVIETVQDAYKAEVWAVIPHSQEVLSNGSAGLMALSHPDHVFTRQLEQIYQKFSPVVPTGAGR
jgi:MinD-like ATPase involved in chromosome partitioning or flagellar assembly